MKKAEKSQISRRRILDAALDLFSHQGYRATQVREISTRAGLSTGSFYHQFPDKEAVFRALLDEYWEAIRSPDFPMSRAWADDAFPHNLEAIGDAARETISRFRPYVALIYVDVVEFDGSHIRRFYANMAGTVEEFLEGNRGELDFSALHPEVSPLEAVMLVTRFFLHYYTIEILFGVPDHFGKPSKQVVREIAAILQRGILADARG